MPFPIKRLFILETITLVLEAYWVSNIRFIILCSFDVKHFDSHKYIASCSLHAYVNKFRLYSVLTRILTRRHALSKTPQCNTLRQNVSEDWVHSVSRDEPIATRIFCSSSKRKQQKFGIKLIIRSLRCTSIRPLVLITLRFLKE
jgi:hypothetical protein